MIRYSRWSWAFLQIIALAVFPLFSKNSAEKSYTPEPQGSLSRIYNILLPMDMRFIGAAGVLVFWRGILYNC